MKEPTEVKCLSSLALKNTESGGREQKKMTSQQGVQV